MSANGYGPGGGPGYGSDGGSGYGSGGGPGYGSGGGPAYGRGPTYDGGPAYGGGPGHDGGPAYGGGPGGAPAGPPPSGPSPVRRAAPWVLGAVGCIAVLVVLALVVVLVVVLNREPDGPDPTAGSDPATTRSTSTEDPSTESVTAGDPPPAPAEVDGHHLQDEDDGIATYYSGDGASVVVTSFRPGVDPDVYTGELTQVGEYGDWTCGITRELTTCATEIRGGALIVMTKGRSPAELASWGDKYIVAWG